MAIIINIDVMLAKMKNERHRAIGEGRHYDGEPVHPEKWQSEGGPLFHLGENMRSAGLSAR